MRPCNLIPRLGTKGYRFMIGFHTVIDYGGLGFDPGTKGF